MPTLYTIGLQRRPLSDLISTLRSHGVDAVIDVRLHNTSQLAGYSKREDFAFLLREGFGIAYEHHPELSPSEEVLYAYRHGGDWETFFASVGALLAERHAETVGAEVLARYKAPCLLCAEHNPNHCHRKVVAEYWAAHLPDVEIVHL